MRERAKSDYVKSFTTEEGPDKSNAIPIQKPRKDTRFTSYHLKNYFRDDQPSQYLATIEAVSSSLMKLVFSADFTPKVRVVHSNEANPIPKAISKTLFHLKSADRLTFGDIQKIRATKQRDLAKLLLTIFCFKEPDLHTENWGLNGDTLIHFDNDRKFALFSCQFSGKDTLVGGETDCDLLLRWPNLIYNLNDAFLIISPDDLLDMVSFKDLKPYNHPFKKINDHRVASPLSDRLSEDPEFIQWKFFYLTKYLLLMTPDRVRTIIESHSIAPDYIDDAFHTEIMMHHQKIKTALLYLPQYQAFLKNFSPDLFRALLSEVHDYNGELCDKLGRLKLPKEKFAIALDALPSEFCELKREAIEALRNDTPEKAAQRCIDLELARITREMSACINTKKALEFENLRNEKIQNAIKYFKILHRNLTPEQEKRCIEFCLENNIDPCEYTNYFKKFPKDTVSQFLSKLMLSSEQYNKPGLIKLRENHNAEVDRRVQFLFTSQRHQLTNEHLKTLWTTFDPEEIKIKTTLIIYILEYCAFEIVPATVIDFMMLKTVEISRLPIVTKGNYSKFDCLFRLISALQAPSSPRMFHPLPHSRFLSPLDQMPRNKVINTLKELITLTDHQLSFTVNELVEFVNTFSANLSRYLDITALKTTAKAECLQPSCAGFFVTLEFKKNKLALDVKPQSPLLSPNAQEGLSISRPVTSPAFLRPCLR